ncbi:MAG TPA: hybrid sensor histidine kinase/response regulator [Cyanobacteria bacterium UBA11369]|nr:hybrid sensor histidine kinase/response regulator [Cyanobacteria bacterium UBA11371]HBE33673.1 hybrid sensor histidine kinase/response regulator [Cyanobacteria bacterium UBA11368]HBE52209.1 hybrid sensor histidine kinase/response regulator [Cyanobacteria bacterium UBA11369]
MKFRKNSLIFQLVSYYSVLSLLVLGLLATTVYLQAQNALEQSVVDRLTVATSLKEYQLQDWIKNQRQDILWLAQVPEIQEQLAILYVKDQYDPERELAYARLRKTISDISAVKPSLQSILITTNGNIVVFSSIDKSLEGKFFRLEEPIVYFTRETAEAAAPKFYTSPQSGEAKITFATGIFNQEGQRLGAIAVNLDLKGIEELIRDRTGLGSSGETYLVGKLANRNVFISGRQAGSKKFAEGLRSFGIDAAVAGSSSFGRYKNYDGIPVVGVYRWLEKQNLALLAEIEQTEAFAPARQLASTIVGIGLLLSGLLLVAVYLLSRQITRPILAMTKTVTKVAAGDLTQTVSIKRKDELGVLAKAFNSMAAQLQSAFDKLEKSKAELEIRVEERTQQLQEALKIVDTASKAKSEFLANMSHELRTPLNGILGYAQILQRSKTLTEKEQKGVGIIYQCGSHLLTLIEDILDLSKIEARKMELHSAEIHFPSFLQSVAEMCRIRAEQKGLAFIYQSDGNLPIGVCIDEKRLRQVLINLLGNAIKFTENGGVTFKIEVMGNGSSHSQAEPLNEGNENELNQLPITNSQLPITKIRFQIEDTGVGMTREQLEKIFLPFEQVGNSKKQSEGTGLGLAISQKIVSLMGSNLEVQSDPGKGSIFSFDLDLPLALNWAETSRVAQQGTIIGFEGQKRKILVVDDRWENRSILVNLLEPIGFELVEAKNGAEGLEKAVEFQPDLIITDLVMPVMDGFEMLRRLRQIGGLKDVVAIASSASVFDIDQHKSLDAGANEFLPKPLQAEKLLEMLRSHMELTWVYEAREPLKKIVSSPAKTLSSEDIIPPSSDILMQLYELAKKGDLDEIVETANQLKQSQPESIPFVQKLVELAENFQVKQIQNFINKFRSAN